MLGMNFYPEPENLLESASFPVLRNSPEPKLKGWAELPFFNVDLSLDVKDSETEQEVEELKGKMLRKNLGKVETSAFDELMQLKQNMPKALGSVPVELV